MNFAKMCATQSSELDREEIEQIFNLFDGNESGSIDVSLLGTVMRQIGLNPTESKLKKLTKSAESNQINFSTFLKIVEDERCEQAPLTEDSIRETLEVFDKDQIGSIMPNDLKYILTTFGEPFSQDEVNEFFTAINHYSEDQGIDYGELAKILTKPNQ